MTSLPSGLASISTRMDDAPNVRGAVDMAKRLRRVWSPEYLTADQERPEMPATKARIAKALRVPSDKAIDRHASLICGPAYRSADRR